MLGYAVFEFAEGDLLVLGADRDLDAFVLLDELVMVTVQPFGVDGIERIFHDLQPVHWNHCPAEHLDGSFRDETVIMRKQRARFRPEISEEKAAEFLDRIALGSDFVAECRFVGFVRLVQALPIAAKLPAVVRAADAVLGRDAVSERGATMRTKLGDQPEPTLP